MVLRPAPAVPAVPSIVAGGGWISKKIKQGKRKVLVDIPEKMQKMHFEEKIVAKCVFTFIVT